MAEAEPLVEQPFGGVDGVSSQRRARVYAQVQPLFDRLTVFDARLPHGVERAEGGEGETPDRPS